MLSGINLSVEVDSMFQRVLQVTEGGKWRPCSTCSEIIKLWWCPAITVCSVRKLIEWHWISRMRLISPGPLAACAIYESHSQLQADKQKFLLAIDAVKIRGRNLRSLFITAAEKSHHAEFLSWNPKHSRIGCLHFLEFHLFSPITQKSG